MEVTAINSAKIVLLSTIWTLGASAQTQAPHPPQCTINFSVVSRDSLNNLDQGLTPKDLKWFQDKVQKKYPTICYESQTLTPPVVFFIASTTGVHHGARTIRRSSESPASGTVTDSSGNSGSYSGTQTTTTATTVPTEVEYPIYTLSIETLKGDKVTVVRNFQRNGLCEPMTVLLGKCQAMHDVIEDAMKWASTNGISDPMHTALQ